LNEQNGESRAEPGQCLEEGEVTEPDADDTAEKKKWKCGARQAFSKAESPNGEQSTGAQKSPKISFSATEQPGRAVAADDRRGKQNGGQKGRQLARQVKTGGRRGRAWTRRARRIPLRLGVIDYL
jgi:hypothetical protein